MNREEMVDELSVGVFWPLVGRLLDRGYDLKGNEAGLIEVMKLVIKRSSYWPESLRIAPEALARVGFRIMDEAEEEWCKGHSLAIKEWWMAQ